MEGKKGGNVLHEPRLTGLDELKLLLKDYVPKAVKCYKHNQYLRRVSDSYANPKSPKREMEGGREFLAGTSFNNFAFVLETEYLASGSIFLHYKLKKSFGVIAHFILLEQQNGFNLYHRHVQPEYRQMGIGGMMLDFGADFMKNYYDNDESVHLNIEMGQLSVRNWAHKNGFRTSKGFEKISQEYATVAEGKSEEYVVGPDTYIFPARMPKEHYYDRDSWHPDRINFARSLRLKMSRVV